MQGVKNVVKNVSSGSTAGIMYVIIIPHSNSSFVLDVIHSVKN